MREVVASFERRAAAQRPAAEAWAGRGPVMEADGEGPPGTADAVLANALALAHFPEPGDVGDLMALGRRLGGRRLALVQERVLVPLDEARRPVTTALVRTLARRAWWRGAAGKAEEPCGEAVFHLLSVGTGPEPPVLRNEADVLGMVREGDLGSWRACVAEARKSPWCGVNDGIGLVDPERHPATAAALSALAALIRHSVRDEERRLVAQHIRSVVDRTDLSQRQFADILGTSPSRLSTYASGLVTPSAAMLLRINRLGRLYERQDLGDSRERGPGVHQAS